jgi:ribokinase
MEQSSKRKVVVVGGYNADLIIPCDRLPSPGRSYVGGPLQVYGGGRGANLAIAAARAGCEVAFVGAHGRDPFGGMARVQLNREGIDIEHFIELADAKTGVSVSMMEVPTGLNYLAVARSANQMIDADMVNAARKVIRNANTVFSELELRPETVWEVMRLCKAFDVPFILDASMIGGVDNLPHNSARCLQADLMDALSATRTSDARSAMTALHRTGCKNVVLIEGFERIWYSDGAESGAISLPPVRAMDRCGSAEALLAWIGVSLLENADLGHACRTGGDAMIYSLQRIGGHTSMPYRSELLAEGGRARFSDFFRSRS